jgi:hypothetical protein
MCLYRNSGKTRKNARSNFLIMFTENSHRMSSENMLRLNRFENDSAFILTTYLLVDIHLYVFFFQQMILFYPTPNQTQKDFSLTMLRK